MQTIEELRAELMYMRERLQKVQSELMKSENNWNWEKFEYLLDERDEIEEKISELNQKISELE